MQISNIGFPLLKHTLGKGWQFSVNSPEKFQKEINSLYQSSTVSIVKLYQR